MDILNTKRVVFVGSSHEGLADAELTCEALRECDATIEPRLWKDFFTAGSLTFEALEDMLDECCGAIFVVRPDDLVRHASSPRTTAARMPRGNVLLEFSLVAGRLGRRNVALCQFNNAALPSDLSGMTVIDFDSESFNTKPRTLRVAESLEKLGRWASLLLTTGLKVPRTALFHGYTGEWEFQLQLSKWHSLKIQEPSHAVVNGSLALFISPNGEGGHGLAEGVLSYQLSKPDNSSSARGPFFIGDLHLIHKLEDVECRREGSIQLISHALGIYPVNEEGETWPILKQFGGTEPWTFKWTFKIATEPRKMIGSIETSASGGTTGTLEATQKRRF